MCLKSEYFTSAKERDKAMAPCVAKRDIKVYKKVTSYSSLREKGKNFFSPHRSFEYTKGFHYYQEGDDKFKITRRYNGPCRFFFEVDMGLHAWRTKEKASQSTGRFTFEMIIPKGSLYYKGSNGDIVADQLIFPKNAKYVPVGNTRSHRK